METLCSIVGKLPLLLLFHYPRFLTTDVFNRDGTIKGLSIQHYPLIHLFMLLSECSSNWSEHGKVFKEQYQNHQPSLKEEENDQLLCLLADRNLRL